MPTLARLTRGPPALALLLLAGCSDKATTDDTTATADCSGVATQIEQIVCLSDAFLATLDEDQRDATLYDFTDSQAKTLWSNLPGQERPGPTFGELSADSLAAAMALAAAVLSSDGYADLQGVLAADDQLGSGGNSDYGSANYHIALLGTPAVDGDWMLMIGGHHLAYNVTFQSGAGSPTPNHIGVEPKGSFTVNGETYAPLDDEAAAMQAVFTALDATTLASAYLDGQVFADIVLGPVEYRTGSYDNVVFPSGDERLGVAVSSLDSATQARVTAAIEQWVNDYASDIASPLLATYTSSEAYADTLVAWGGDKSAGVDLEEAGTYLRIDGPRLWLELACQAGVVDPNQTHYHSMYRDKETDYGGAL